MIHMDFDAAAEKQEACGALAVESGWLPAGDFVAQALAGGSVVGVVTSRLYRSVAAVMLRVSGFASGWRSCLASAC